MLEHLVETLISIENTEKDNNSFSEAVDFATVVKDMKDDENEVKTDGKSFAEVIASMKIPTNVSEKEKMDYITSVIDHDFYKKNIPGKCITMSDDEYKKFDTCIQKCNECGEITRDDRNTIMKLVIALLKALPSTSSDHPCDDHVKHAVDGAYQTLTELKPSYDEKLSERDNLERKLNEMSKILKD